MWWKSSCYILLAFLLASVFAQECREERSIKEKALRGFIFKKLLVTSFDQCNINCEKEVTCQSFNFVTGEHSCVLKNCELNNRTKEARPENFCSDPDRLYIRRLNGRASLGSTTELPAESCREIKASEGKDAISGKYWLDPTRSGKAVLVHCNMEATNCADIYEAGKRRDGVYTIIPDDLLVFRVFCDQTTAGGGWTVFQKRVNGSVDFYRNWTDYKHGFGDLNSEFWLGLDKVHRLTSDKNNTLRVDLEDFEGNTRYAEYEMFGVMDENDKYKLILGSYSGNAGDSLGHKHRGMPFTTKDQDNDQCDGCNCAISYKGAWWYNDCHGSNLNGLYLRGKHTSYADGVNWERWKRYYYSLKKTEMKIRPMDF